MTIEVFPVHHTQHFMKTEALLDSGANAIYIHQQGLCSENETPLTFLLFDPILVYNVDGIWNATR
jgi:hypothetical protein